MPLVCLGLSHHTASLEVREKHAISPTRIAETLTALCDYEAVHEAVMISTCNRMEIYAELTDYESGIAQLKLFLQNFSHRSIADLDSYLYTLLGSAAVEHLFRVATGLDSMLIGEAEILGQVKSAYLAAQRAGSLGKTLHLLMREALSVGKRARSRTGIGEASVSVATAAVELARTHLGTLTTSNVLIIGAGKMGMLAARRLQALGARRIVVANRSLARAQEVVTALGSGHAIELTQLVSAVTDADLVLTAVGADTFLLSHALMSQTLALRSERPLVIMDIAVPRDVDPTVGQLTGVHLIDIDALHHVVEDTLDRRRKAIPLVETLIQNHVERYTRWYRVRPAVPVLSALARKAEAMRLAEVERIFARCPNLTARERKLIIGSTMRIVSKLLHGSFANVRDKILHDPNATTEQTRILTELFELHLPSSELSVVSEEVRLSSNRFHPVESR